MKLYRLLILITFLGFISCNSEVDQLNNKLEELSELTPYECMQLLDNMDDGIDENNIAGLIEKDYLKYSAGLITLESLQILINSTTAASEIVIPTPNTSGCSVSGIGFHMGSTIAIKFNSDGRFNYSDKLMNQPKSFWGTWQQQGNKIITTNDRSTTGMGIGQQNTYAYDCDKLTIGSFSLIKD